MLENYKVQSMEEWADVNADLILTDPPFGLEFEGKPSNYNRKAENVVDGYVEWPLENYREKINDLLFVIHKNLKTTGSALIFSGWNHSNIIHSAINNAPPFTLQGKLYWSYNFAPYCTRRPAHNVYEIFWITHSDEWYYTNTCTTEHCSQGEANLSSLCFKRDYTRNMPKYPTRLPFDLLKCLLEHFSQPDDLVFDPLAGSGMVGIVAQSLSRRFLLGDLNKHGKDVFEALIEHYRKEHR